MVFNFADNSFSFDSVLLHGHEFSLTLFDMILFVFVDFLAENFLLAGIVTFFIGEVNFNILIFLKKDC